MFELFYKATSTTTYCNLYDWLYILLPFEMPIESDITPQVLSDALQEISCNFAYKMLFLEISLSLEGQNNGNRSFQIAELTNLYMKAVESLQGRFEQGFMFFHNKIQNLMKKRSVVEELFKSVNSSLSQSQKTMMVISKAQVQQRREEYDIRMTLQNEKFDHIKVREMINNAEMKINMIESRMKTGIFSQEEILAKRIKLRKLKSQSSTNNDQKTTIKCNLFQKRVHTENAEQYFASQGQNGNESIIRAKNRKKSSEKERKRKIAVFNSFAHQIKT